MFKQGNIPWNKNKRYHFSKGKICKNCGKNYWTKGKYYCSMKCRDSDEDYIEMMGIVSKNKWVNREHPRGMLGKKHSKETLEKYNNRIPWNKGLTKETDERIRIAGLKESKFKKEFFRIHPEKHPNYLQKNISKPQLNLYKLIKKRFKDSTLNYPLRTNKSIRFLDVAIPSLKIDFEYEGSYWHQDEHKDLRREFEIRDMGWAVIRICDEKHLNDRTIDIALNVLKTKNV